MRDHANAVALGANSVTKAAVANNEATVKRRFISGFAADNAAGVVSLGDAGRASVNKCCCRSNSATTSTDAINGSQLP